MAENDTTLLTAARAAFARGEWDSAHRDFARVRARGELQTEDLDRFSSTLWWIGEVRESVSLSEEVYHRYEDDGAPLSVAVQFGCGALLLAGLLTRWAGLLVAANFAVAVLMVHWNESYRAWWPAIVLVFLGLHFAAAGSGKFGLDRLFGGRR